VLKVAVDALGIEAAKFSRNDQLRITAAMERLGWVRAPRTGGARWWVQSEDAATAAAEARHAQ